MVLLCRIMIGVMLCLVLKGISAATAVSTSQSWVSAAVHQTALLPFTFHPPSPFWEFISIRWEFITINKSIPILLYLLEKCKQDGIPHQWWERECHTDKEVNDVYQQRADILRNGTLKIHPVGINDAGIYQATIRTLGVRHHATVNLTVTEGSGTLRKFSIENTIRMVLACLILCFLGLVVVEHVYNFECHPRKEGCGTPGRFTLGSSQYVNCGPSSPFMECKKQ